MQPSEGSTRGTIYVVDDDSSFRASAEAVLTAAGYAVRAFERSQALFEDSPPAGPACLILDLRLRQESGLAIQEQLAQNGWKLPVIFVSGHGTVASAASAMRAGAFDFLEKPIPRSDLLARVAQALVADGERLSRDREVAPLLERYRSLTAREREVAAGIERGLSSKQIAHELSTSIRTIEHHRSRILRKMEASNSAELSRSLTLVRMHGGPAAMQALSKPARADAPPEPGRGHVES
jgi:FixJ family two-component response regulator